MAAPAIYSFPESAVIQQLERERLPIVAANQVGNRILPVNTENASDVLWEIRDDVVGLAFARGAGEKFPVVDNTGITRFSTQPGRFGERMNMREEQIERMRTPGTLGDTVDVSAEIGDMQNQLAYREQMLIEVIRWNLLVYGIAKAARKDGTLVEVARYTPLAYNPTYLWTDTANSTPLQDIRNLTINFNGNGHEFGLGAGLYMNRYTSQLMFANRNNADLYGRRVTGLGTANSVPQVNELLTGESLANITVYDETYKDSTGTVQRFIPNGYAVAVGYRMGTGVQAGEYIMTRNASNAGGAPGIYAATGLMDDAPRLPWTERGHNGGVRIRYRRQIVVMKVA